MVRLNPELDALEAHLNREEKEKGFSISRRTCFAAKLAEVVVPKRGSGLLKRMARKLERLSLRRIDRQEETAAIEDAEDIPAITRSVRKKVRRKLKSRRYPAKYEPTTICGPDGLAYS